MMTGTMTEHTWMDDPALSTTSLESFERMMSSQQHRSICRSEESEAESDQSSTPWSPPAWRKGTSGWQQRHNLAPTSHDAKASRQSSRRHWHADVAEDHDDTLLPTRIPLPESPEKDTPFSVERTPDYRFSASTTPYPRDSRAEKESSAAAEGPSNCMHLGHVSRLLGCRQLIISDIRFAIRAEVQHKTEPLEQAVEWLKRKIDRISIKSILTGLFVAFLSLFMLKSLFSAPQPLPSPDISKAVDLAKTFEPMIYYSESGMRQVHQLQDTSVAVWDLGESIQNANMTEASAIASQLNSLRNSLEILTFELTKFFVEVDGDVDSLLLIMDWAKRRLLGLEPVSSGSISTATDNIHGLLLHTGFLSASDGSLNLLGRALRGVFGTTTLQRNYDVLQKTFQDFLNVLEESINNELQHSISLFKLFNEIDKQFKNLQHSTIRETNNQENEEMEMLSSLWIKLVGPRAAHVKKFEKNRELLKNIRSQTILNRGIVQTHNTKLLQMKINLERLRRKVVTQIVRGNETSIVPVQEQIAGLDETYLYLRSIREQQKRKVLDNDFNFGNQAHVKREEIGS